MTQETKWTRGPWQKNYGRRHSPDECDIEIVGDIFVLANINGPNYAHCESNAALISVAPEMAEALRAEEEADELFDAADEYTHRADGEGWLNDPTGSLHVTEAWDRARQARDRAKELRRAALQKAGG